MQNKSISPKNKSISPKGGGQQVPNLLKTEKIKSMKREIKAMKTANDQPMTMIKTTKSMILKMETNTYFTMKMKMIK